MKTTPSKPSQPNLECIARLCHLLRTSNAKSPQSRKSLATTLGVSERSIQRQLDWLKERGAKITHSIQNGYAMSDGAWVLPQPGVVMTQHMLTALMIAQKALSAYGGTPLAETLEGVFRALTGDSVADAMFADMRDAASEVSFSATRSPVISQNVWSIVLQGLATGHTIEVQYQGWKDTAPSKHALNPYHITCLDGVWYLLAGTTTRVEARQYALHRMSSPRLTDIRTFTEHSTLPAEGARKSFGQFIGTGKSVPMKVRFDKEILPLVHGYQWHPHQKVTKRPDGSLEVSFPVDSGGLWPFYHVVRWILSFGKHVEVVAPKELKTLVHDAAQTLAVRHR